MMIALLPIRVDKDAETHCDMNPQLEKGDRSWLTTAGLVRGTNVKTLAPDRGCPKDMKGLRVCRHGMRALRVPASWRPPKKRSRTWPVAPATSRTAPRTRARSRPQRRLRPP